MSKRQKWQNIETQNVKSDKTSKAQNARNLAQYARNLVQDAHTTTSVA